MKFRWLAPPSHRDHGFRLGDSSKRQFYPSHGAHISFSSPPPFPPSSVTSFQSSLQKCDQPANPRAVLLLLYMYLSTSSLPPSLPPSPTCAHNLPRVPASEPAATSSLSFSEFNLPGRLANATWNVTHFQLSKDRSARKQSGTDCGKRVQSNMKRI